MLNLFNLLNSIISLEVPGLLSQKVPFLFYDTTSETIPKLTSKINDSRVGDNESIESPSATWKKRRGETDPSRR